ncbi:hypothetical protein BpHYR1_048319 [Brachionus plicatilis]|uniref:Uncharacterized protein n=1 Tax=Brachionus plicatilis TaxID=10195 RepID=A0A3M7PKF1_BRAPC|nr:hypothetical protein BpHYR1_048319 [Brachionus plicatilis]
MSEQIRYLVVLVNTGRTGPLSELAPLKSEPSRPLSKNNLYTFGFVFILDNDKLDTFDRIELYTLVNLALPLSQLVEPVTSNYTPKQKRKKKCGEKNATNGQKPRIYSIQSSCKNCL